MWNKKVINELDDTLTRVPFTLYFQGQIVSREWDFKVKSEIFYISVKNGSIATKQKANISIEIKAPNGTIRFGHDLDLEFSRSNMELAISQLKMVWLPRI